MANPLSRFHLTSRNRTAEIKYFDYIPENVSKDFTRIENIDVIINSWNNILLTPRGTYDHDPNYGSGLFDLIFEPVDGDTQNIIREEIYNSVYYYDNRATIKNITIKFLKGASSKKGFNVKIDVEYKGTVKELTIDITNSYGQ